MHISRSTYEVESRLWVLLGEKGNSSSAIGCRANLWKQFLICLQKPTLKRTSVARTSACRTREIVNVDSSVHTQVNKIILPIWHLPPPQCEKSSNAYQFFCAECQPQSMRTVQVKIPKVASHPQ
jgi:hypothetical protein